MELKKNPKADLRNKITLFFQIGLILVLLITWRAIEFKTYDRVIAEKVEEEFIPVEEEDIPITKMQYRKPPPPPPPPPVIDIIKVVEDKEVVQETVFEKTEVEEEDDIPDAPIDFGDPGEDTGDEEIGDVPFAMISESPLFPGCEKEKGFKARKDCMQEKITKFVNRKFDRGIGQEVGLSGLQRVFVAFKIDKNGNVVDIKARGKHPRLQQEAQRVIGLLPKMKPGKQRDKPVGVLYSLPIAFRVDD